MPNGTRARPNLRPDHNGRQRALYESNKKKIFATQTICALCGQPVDFKVKHPEPLSPTIDHIIPLDKGGHPSDISNMQLAHFCCNRQKSNKIVPKIEFAKQLEVIGNRELPQSFDWKNL